MKNLRSCAWCMVRSSALDHTPHWEPRVPLRVEEVFTALYVINVPKCEQSGHMCCQQWDGCPHVASGY